MTCFLCGRQIRREDPEPVEKKNEGKTIYAHQKCWEEEWKYSPKPEA